MKIVSILGTNGFVARHAIVLFLKKTVEQTAIAQGH
jgi:hypothetical protein